NNGNYGPGCGNNFLDGFRGVLRSPEGRTSECYDAVQASLWNVEVDHRESERCGRTNFPAVNTNIPGGQSTGYGNNGNYGPGCGNNSNYGPGCGTNGNYGQTPGNNSL